ncbi:DUF1573 domain-containing protein [Winogradskyella litoriviva]|uniref:DUF1573 domain-containing protein n=1 Tax=Winogradskyella litoriviva TaxID=1220182 RepID=A0ABX2E566_9FLAO|nr:DUF1573 domain-containing protein [Winogradskyella litoriviva]NRD23136.1 DUF1573 domain-containing protein [Winogradskyella litoriviva]
MKNVLVVVFVGLMSLGVFAQDTQAKIEFKTTTIDYGTIEKGSDGKRTFEFTNTGDAPLIIENAKSTCGCTVPSWPKKPILPGESGEIVVKYNTSRLNKIAKTITVTTNSNPKTIALRIKGMVVDSNKASVLEKKSKSLIEE